MASQVGVQRVGFTVTEKRRLRKTKLHAGGWGNPHSIYHVLIPCLPHTVVQYSITPLSLCIHWLS